MEYWKVLSVTIVRRQEKFLNSRRSRMDKTVTFWPWWQHFNSFCFETLSFFPLFSFFFFCYAKKEGEGGGGGEDSPPPPRCHRTCAQLKELEPAVHSEPSQTSKMELFSKMINGFQPRISFSYSSGLDTPRIVFNFKFNFSSLTKKGFFCKNSLRL